MRGVRWRRLALLVAFAVGVVRAGDATEDPADPVFERYMRAHRLMEQGVSELPGQLERMAKRDPFAADLVDRLLWFSEPEDGAVEAIAEALRSADADLRACAAYGARRLPDNEEWLALLPALAKLASDDDSMEVRTHALLAIARAEDRGRGPAIYAALARGLRAPDPGVRAAAAVAAAWIGDDGKNGAALDAVLRAASAEARDEPILERALLAFRGTGDMPDLPEVPLPVGLVDRRPEFPSFAERAPRALNRPAGVGWLRRDSLDLGNAWLVGQQQKDGTWGGTEDSCLAILALLGSGYTDRGRQGSRRKKWRPQRSPATGRAIRRGLFALIRDASGHELIAHVFAEAYAMTGDAMYERVARANVAALRRQKRLSVWAADALHAARRAGIDVPADLFGRAKTRSPGGRAWLRTIQGRPANLAPFRKDPLAWSEDADLESLLFTAKVTIRAGGETWADWSRPSYRQLLRTQKRVTKETMHDVGKPGSTVGSWDPIGRWSRVATTAIINRTFAIHFDSPR